MAPTRRGSFSRLGRRAERSVYMLVHPHSLNADPHELLNEMHAHVAPVHGPAVEMHPLDACAHSFAAETHKPLVLTCSFFAS